MNLFNINKKLKKALDKIKIDKQKNSSLIGDFFSKNASLKKTVKLNSNVIYQFNYLSELSKTFIIEILNFKSLVNLECNFASNEGVWEQIIEKLYLSLDQKRPIVFENFIIDWKKEDNFLDYPVLLKNEKSIKNNTIIENWAKDQNEKVVKAFSVFNKIINYQMKNDKLHLLIKHKDKQILVFLQKNNEYGILFSEGVI